MLWATLLSDGRWEIENVCGAHLGTLVSHCLLYITRYLFQRVFGSFSLHQLGIKYLRIDHGAELKISFARNEYIMTLNRFVSYSKMIAILHERARRL